MCLAIPMKVIEIRADKSALAEVSGITTEVSVALLKKVEIGDYIIVHTGFAIEVWDTEEAEKTLAVMGEMAQAGKWGGDDAE